ncbi:MAG: 2-hydroxymuconate tautomerase-like protein [Nitrospira sp.]|jgi:4-oxalocrotonate tautomerase|nr:MAG: 2-hydroxymuconate tautomerase-like protein [Nitrospira sp.]
MPYVLMQVTREGVTLEQKEALIKGVTDLLVSVLNKKPAQTFVVIEEVETDNWGVAGMTVTKYRRHEHTADGRSQPLPQSSRDQLGDIPCSGET